MAFRFIGRYILATHEHQLRSGVLVHARVIIFRRKANIAHASAEECFATGDSQREQPAEPTLVPRGYGH